MYSYRCYIQTRAISYMYIQVETVIKRQISCNKRKCITFPTAGQLKIALGYNNNIKYQLRSFIQPLATRWEKWLHIDT